jgi:multidrug efflux pump subunit AcrB
VLLAGLLGSVAVGAIGFGLLALRIADYPFGFNPLLGLAGLIGLALNDSIVVLAAIRADPEARAGVLPAVVRATLSCSRHVIATTLTTIGAFLPLLVDGGAFWPPLAVVIAGGVLGASLLALLWVPAGYLILVRLFSGLKRTETQDPVAT